MIHGWCQRVVIGLAVGAALSVARGADADADYLSLFNQLREAERFEASGEGEQACAAYRELHLGLRQFQRAYPTWHPEVVAFRLRTIAAGVDRLCREPSPEAAGAPPHQTADLAEEIQPLRSEDLLRLRLRQLERQRDELQEKLREAWAARPATADHPELAHAEDRIRTLEKEVAVLRFAALPGPTPEPAAQAQIDSSPDARGALQAQLRVLKQQLELERQKVAALEATATALGARLAGVVEARPTDPPPSGAPPEKRSAEPSAGGSALEQGRALLDAGEVDEAILVLGRGAQDPESSAELLSLLGGAFLSKGLADPAEAVARRALSVDPSCAEAHRVMARLCLLRSPPARSLARWHYHEARRHGLTTDPALEGLLSDAPTDPS